MFGCVVSSLDMATTDNLMFQPCLGSCFGSLISSGLHRYRWLHRKCTVIFLYSLNCSLVDKFHVVLIARVSIWSLKRLKAKSLLNKDDSKYWVVISICNLQHHKVTWIMYTPGQKHSREVCASIPSHYRGPSHLLFCMEWWLFQNKKHQQHPMMALLIKMHMAEFTKSCEFRDLRSVIMDGTIFPIMLITEIDLLIAAEEKESRGSTTESGICLPRNKRVHGQQHLPMYKQGGSWRHLILWPHGLKWSSNHGNQEVWWSEMGKWAAPSPIYKMPWKMVLFISQWQK